MALHLEILATDMAPILHLKCKFSTAHHLTRILHLVLTKIEQVAQPHSHFRLLLLLQETSDWSKAKTVVTREHLDVTEIVEFSLTQVAETLKRDIHQTKDLVHNDPPAKCQRDYHHDDYYQCSKKDKYKSHSCIPAGAEDKDWDADLDPAESSLERAHQSYQADQGGTTQMDDHTIPHDYYSRPPEPQPGSYPGDEQLTSKNTTYAELQDSLITQKKEDLILQGRVETSMSTETSSTEGY